jgi:tetratricopeptide (TPR) repeat protein
VSPESDSAVKLLQGVITGASIAAPAILSEWQLRSHERLREEAAKRNHLIRRAMARSLSRALRAAEANEELSVLVPKDLRDQFFEIWPSLLDRCQSDDTLVEDLFPLSLSEDQWTLLTSFYDDLTDPSLASRPEEFRQRLAAQEVVSQRALARLISRLPLERNPEELLSLFGRQLEQVWPTSDSEAFALKLLPLYRMAFASLCSEGGPESNAIFLKGQKATLAELRELHSLLEKLDAGLATLLQVTKGEGERTRNTVRDEGEKTRQEIESLDEVIRLAIAEAMEKALASGALPAATAEKKQELIEQAVQEMPKVAEELRQSNSSVATPNVESLLASGRIQEARAAAQSQFDHAQKAKQASEATFAQACYDMGRINELSFHWSAALDNYRQAWKLSRERNPEIGFRLAFLTATLCNYDEAIDTYNSVLPLFSEPYDKARTLINLGALYADCHRGKDAEETFLNALRRLLPQAGPLDFGLARLGAAALVNLGILYQNRGNSEKAAKAYSDAIAILIELSKIVGESGITDLAYAAVNLGDLLLDQDFYQDAERSLTVALAWLRNSGQRFDRESRLHQGKLLESLGRLYEATARPEHSENALKQALSIFHVSEDSISPALADHEARTLVNIGNFYARSGRLQEAESSVLKGIAIFRDLSTLSPSTFEPLLAIAYANLGSIYLESQDFDKAVAQFAEQLAILKKQLVNDTEECKREYLEALVYFSRLNISSGNLNAADEHLCEAEELIGPLMGASPERWGDRYAHTAVRLKLEQNQLVDVVGEIGVLVDRLKSA